MMFNIRKSRWFIAAAATALGGAGLVYGCSSSPQHGTSTRKDASTDGSQDSSQDVSQDVTQQDVTQQDVTQDHAKPDANPNCQGDGTACTSNAQCCSAVCDPKLHTCATPTTCKAAGAACQSPTDCCTMVCTGGTCGKKLCTSDNLACTTNAQCCSAQCVAGDGGKYCKPLNTTCSTAGNACTQNSDCCSTLCSGGRCAGVVSFCRQTGDACGSDNACCTGICNKQAGASLGVCTEPSAPGTTGCLVAGEACGGGMVPEGGTIGEGGVPACGGSCCSRSCAPYGPTGVFVCQPPSGCHPTGEICRKDSDCCGSPGMPGGNGSVRCSIGPGQTVGRCNNGNACRPAGAVCKLATSSCNAENNCCAGNVNQDPGACQQDLLGIPRCTGVGNCADAGSKVGQACATSADCCGLPCLPNPNAGDGGAPFICGASCVQAGGACTTNADCCAGLPCITQPGSTQGVCEIPTVDGGLPEGGVPEGGTPEGSTPPEGGTEASIPPGLCALYGQQCATTSDCCNGVPCTAGRCSYPIH